MPYEYSTRYNMLNQKILLGITGGIAAYKTAELVSILRKENFEIRTVMTKAAQKFITPLTLRSLSNNNVYTDMFEHESENNMNHISLSRWAGMILIAPATANFMAKLAHGFCDDLLSTLCVAKSKKTPIAIVPAMNKEMWQAETTQINLNTLKKRNISILGPNEGTQACGEYGMGRMLEPQEILTYLKEQNHSTILAKKKILITAGPTLEPIDPVRYISNFSSGKMGYAIAETLSNIGASVTLISGPTNLLPPVNVKLINVTTANEMFNSVMRIASEQDIFISVAAVADYSPSSIADKKIKKTNSDFQIYMKSNEDILKKVASLSPPPITIGFAAETENILENAKKKLETKKIDMIIANKVGKNLGFNTETNHLFILQRNSKKFTELKPQQKSSLAQKLIPIFENLLSKHHTKLYS